MNKAHKAILIRLKQEHTRGSLTLAVMALLAKPRYGYALIDQLAKSGIETTQDTLYPLLRRLEKQGLLESEWIIDDSTRPRKYYRTSKFGSDTFPIIKEDWLTYVNNVKEILS
jgi:PadR family transcriptional regulator PadR